jgi:hypothetical protein
LGETKPYRGRSVLSRADATVTLSFFAWASCSIAVGRAIEATPWSKAKATVTAAPADRRRIEREVRFMTVLVKCIQGCVEVGRLSR